MNIKKLDYYSIGAKPKIIWLIDRRSLSGSQDIKIGEWLAEKPGRAAIDNKKFNIYYYIFDQEEVVVELKLRFGGHA